MTLGFKEYFDKEKKKPTYFLEKIKASAGIMTCAIETKIYGRYPNMLRGEHQIIEIKPKIHTIREGHRWKAGDKIHMAYGVRTKNYRQFNKGIPILQVVKSVQDIYIENDSYCGSLRLKISIDGLQFCDIIEAGIFGYDHARLNRLAINDGFGCGIGPDTEYLPFWKWFNDDFEGQIIHWTDFRY